MKPTFKQFLEEGAIYDRVERLALQMLGSKNVHKTKTIGDDILDKAKEEEHRFVDSALGKWCVSIFILDKLRFARIEPPKGAMADGTIDKPDYFIVKRAVSESSKGEQGQYANDQAERSMINKIIELCMKGGKTPQNYSKAYDFLESDWGGEVWDKHYENFVALHPDNRANFSGAQYGRFKKEVVDSFRKWKSGTKFTGKPLPKNHQ